jgi:hypothetical protein
MKGILMKNNKELIDFILSLKDLKIEYKPRLKHYVISRKVKGCLVTGWDIINHVKFMYETMKLKKMQTS